MVDLITSQEELLSLMVFNIQQKEYSLLLVVQVLHHVIKQSNKLSI
jgi:hypothetical protein